METLKDMDLFVRVVRAGSLSGAARDARTSTPSVVRHVNSLEASLGIRLLNRSTRKISLTEAGKIYHARAVKILAEVRNTRAELGELGAEPQGTLHVLSRVLVGSHYMPSIISSFLRAYPEINVILSLSDKPVDIIDQDIDIVIHNGKLEDSALTARRLAGSPRVLCASPGYLRGKKMPRCPEDLASHQCIAYRFDKAQTNWRFQGPGGPRTLSIAGHIQTNNGHVLHSLVLRGHGITILPEWSVKADIESGRLCRVLSNYKCTTTDPSFEQVIYAVYRKTTHPARKLSLFIDFVSKTFRELQQQGWPQQIDDDTGATPGDHSSTFRKAD